MLEKKCIASCFSRELRRAKVRANGRVGQAHIDSVLPSKKSSLQKIFGSNLTLHPPARRRRGASAPPRPPSPPSPILSYFSRGDAKLNGGWAGLVLRFVLCEHRIDEIHPRWASTYTHQ